MPLALLVLALSSFAIGTTEFVITGLLPEVVGFGKDAPNLVSTINIGAFNTGNALGAWAGGVVIDAGFDLTRVPLAAALMALIGFGATALTYLSARGRAALAPAK
ncbi:MFS transporter, DHA1 family, inner membrane transport protein [Rhizobium aethiopicum]|uniref:MFS transporter, DHA1 family, inner membrane transport protein n=1 Tax=Rhizobium aethiopicum TaxID=1138170 RepID=A0A1C3XYD8_9HYPH|nr:MFS transporter, DHA1 family, inner membrane transport protein [Rhizobium aethiopicum]